MVRTIKEGLNYSIVTRNNKDYSIIDNKTGYIMFAIDCSLDICLKKLELLEV